MKILSTTLYLKTLLLVTTLMVGRSLCAQENGGGGLGAVSTCPAAPDIAAAAIAVTLSPDSGLNGAQATAQIRNIVHQSTVSAPYVAAQIAVAAVQTLSKSATATSASGQGMPNGTTAVQAKAATASQSMTTTEGFKDAVTAIIKGVISGSPSGANDLATLTQVSAAVALELVKDAAEQAARTAAMKQVGTASKTNELPMDNVKDAVAVTDAFVAAVTVAATQLGFNSKQVADAITAAGEVAVDMASKVDGSVAAGVAGAQRVAQEVASQVASAVATDIKQQAESSSTSKGQQSQQNQNNNQNAPNPTAAGLPGQSQNPFSGVQPIPRPNPTLNPTPAPNPTPNPISTPTPSSPF